MTEPTHLIIGVYDLQDSFCIFRESYLRPYVAEVQAIQACTNLQELADLIPTLNIAWSPLDPEDETDEEEWASTPWDWKQAGAVQDGDWPPMPTSHVLDAFNADEPIWEALFSIEGVEQVGTTLNGDYLHIPADGEDELVAALEGAGYLVTRDDSLIAPLEMP